MKKVFKFGCLGIIGVIVLLLIIGMLATKDAPKTPATSTPQEQGKGETEGDKAEEKAEEKAKIGDELQVGKVTFKVNGIEEVNQITAGKGMFKYTPDSEGAVFLIVNITVKNDDTSMIQTDSSFFKLNAASGAQYSPSTILVADDKFFTFEGINPGLALTGNVVFEVPSGLTDIDLRVQTGLWGTENGLINLK